MTDKQQRFVEEYLIDLDKTKAAIRAGYSPKSAAQIGRELMQKTAIADAVARAKAERSKRTGYNADRVLRELGKIAFCDMTQLLDMDTAEIKPEATAEDRSVISSVKVRYIPVKRVNDDGELVTVQAIEREVKCCDKLRALEMLSKHLGLNEKGSFTPGGEKPEDDPLTKALKEEAERLENAPE